MAAADPMTSTRLEAVLQEASLRAGVADFPDDVACCTRVAFAGSARAFGTAGDGLDTIDDDNQLSKVLDHAVARVKVVNAINYCGGPATNVIGMQLSRRERHGLVRMSDVTSGRPFSGLHEYGHNLGLSHLGSPRALMYPTVNGDNSVLSEGECRVPPAFDLGGSRRRTSGPAPTTYSRADPVDNCSSGRTRTGGRRRRRHGDACEARIGRERRS